MILSILSFALILLGSLTYSSPYEGAGIQLYTPDKTKTLLVQGLRSGKWGWTKGHRDADDRSWLETAVREVKEESGFLLGFDYYICNSFPEQWGKRLYWQGITFFDQPTPFHNKSEHRDLQWVSIQDLQGLDLTKDIQEWRVVSGEVKCDFDGKIDSVSSD